MEGYFYRHGVATMVTLRIRNCASLNKTLEKALLSRHAGTYKVTWNDGTQSSFSLSKLVKHYLDVLCTQALGGEQGMGRDFSGNPFSVAAVIQGSKEYETVPVKQGNDIHKALESLVTWNKNWSKTNPPQLEEKALPIKNDKGNHILYGDRQGRAVWFPLLFAPPSHGHKHAIGWYFRNLMLASMQTASLGAFLKYTTDQFQNGKTISGSQKHWASKAINALERLSQGQNTYRTWSTHAQIEQNSFRETIDYLKSKL